MDVMDILISNLKQIPPLLIEFAPSVILALLILLIGRAITKNLSKATVTGTRRIPNFDETLARFCGSVVLVAGTIIVLIATLAAMKINLAFLATIVAALVVALGFALQESLGDLAAGVMIALFRPFKFGDEVELAGETGVVTKLGLFSTALKTRDNIEIFVGNGAAFGSTIKNYFAFTDRRLDMDFGVSYDADMDAAEAAILSVVEGDTRIHTSPEPWARVTSLGDSAVNIQLRVYCHADEYRHIKMDISHRVKQALDKAGIEIPYEHNVIIPVKAD